MHILYLCSGTVQEVRDVVNKVRMFQHKPDGEVTMRYLQDGSGFPAPVMQDPIHYPHGSAFLAPGPLGLCHPVPDDARLKRAMTSAAVEHKKIFDMYNLPENVEPGSIMEKAMKFWKRKQNRKQKAMEKRLQREMQKIRRTEAAVGGGDGEVGGGDGTNAQTPAADEKDGKSVAEEDIDDDDLIASNPFGPGSSNIVGSVCFGLERARIALQKAMRNAAIKAPRLPQLGSHQP